MESPFSTFLQAVVRVRCVDGAVMTASLLGRMMGSRPEAMRSLVVRSMLRHGRCVRVLGPVFVQVRHPLSRVCSALGSLPTPRPTKNNQNAASNLLPIFQNSLLSHKSIQRRMINRIPQFRESQCKEKFGKIEVTFFKFQIYHFILALKPIYDGFYINE